MKFLRPAVVLALLTAAAIPGRAYYHFVRFRAAPNGPIATVEKFDLAALPDNTVYFYLSAERPRLVVNDSYEALLSQVRQALAVWDSAPTSQLRVAFGGIVEGPLPGRAPAGEIAFAELPPGVIGLGGPVTSGEGDAGFTPIVRSQVILSNDLTLGVRPRASYSELFFNSLVHEIGHALGLQHTLSGSVMSVDVTRATTRARPLGQDDVAGLSVLYPTADFSSIHGEISGRVSDLGGRPVALASIVALHPGGEVVSALSGPDGRYRMEGLPPGRYLVYVHPLPLATQASMGPGNLVLPTAADGSDLQAGEVFRTIFFGGGNRPERSPPIGVIAGERVRDVDFRVTPRRNLPLYNVSTFSFPGNGAPGVHPAFLDLIGQEGFILAAGVGLDGGVEGVSVQAIGRELKVSPPALYRPDPRFARIDLAAAEFAAFGPVHLLFRLPDNDIYILPAAVQLTERPAPVLHWVIPDFFSLTDWRVGGEGLNPGSLVFFDGLPARIMSFDSVFGEIVVEPPPGPPGGRAVITVLNSDGQSSAFTLPDGNVAFPYPDAPGSSIEVLPAAAGPDTDLVIEIRGRNTAFIDGETEVGFGSSDIVVRGVEVVSPERLRAVVTVLPSAAPGVYTVSAVSGLAVSVLEDGFRITESSAVDDRSPTLRFGALVNSATNRPVLSPGVLATLYGEKLRDATVVSDAASALRVTFDGTPAQILSASAKQINLAVPPSLEPGVVEMRVFNGRAESDPMLVRLNRVSPGLFGAIHPGGAAVALENPLRPGAKLELLATGLGGGAPPFVQVIVSGVRLRAAAVRKAESMPGLYSILVKLPAVNAIAANVVEVSLLVEGRSSNRLRLPFTAKPAPSPDVVSSASVTDAAAERLSK